MPELTYRLMIRAFRLIFVLLGLRIEVRGSQNLPTSGPAIVACNHIGYLDFAFVGLAGHADTSSSVSRSARPRPPLTPPIPLTARSAGRTRSAQSTP
jgi:hypothetical protein